MDSTGIVLNVVIIFVLVLGELLLSDFTEGKLFHLQLCRLSDESIYWINSKTSWDVWLI